MAQHYSDPAREASPHALPDLETFYSDGKDPDTLSVGWYWQACFPGCLPDGDANGPFDTEAEAVADARERYASVEPADDPDAWAGGFADNH